MKKIDLAIQIGYRQAGPFVNTAKRILDKDIETWRDLTVKELQTIYDAPRTNKKTGV